MLKIPVWPYADQKEEEKLKEVLNSSVWWRNPGTQVKAFEQEYADFCHCNGAISTANGTVAIEIALKALKIGAGDEVIVPAFTFYSTVSAVLAVGAIPVLVDVSADDYCINSESIRKEISDKTKAVIVVHMAGNVVDMDAVNAVAREYDLYVIEDAAHAHGAEYKGKKAGSLGICGTFSFQNAKLLTAGEGGMLTSNDREFLNMAFLESNCGRAEGDTDYQHILVGTNARLSEFQGAVLRMQLARLNEQLRKRDNNYQYLKMQLEKIDGIVLQKIGKDVTLNSHYMVMFYYDEKYFKGSRKEFVQYLRENGIPCNRAFEALHRLPVFQSLDKERFKIAKEGGCPNSRRIADTVVCLNHNILLGDKVLMEEIADVIRQYRKE
ncbi:MAG: DegT/DnrJ/EryC1/StrS family aminotransferase [Lachnospiraceae bacterium]|nr:DegT/DnrJ/EryC1/StrS family aminotransferase [Lachnospiraceae bacterium]